MDYKNESTFRKAVKYARSFYEAGVFDTYQDGKYLKELQIQKDEFFRVKKQMQDQRRLYNKKQTVEARFEHLCEELTNAASRLHDLKPLQPQKYESEVTTREAVLFISDIHYGMVTDNIWNKYNIEICENRLTRLIELTRKHLLENGVHKLNIVLLGDLAHGSIHAGCRVDAEEETCEQLMHVTERIAETIDELANCVEYTSVYSTYGNHMRTIQNKHDSKHSDNMERLVPWWLKQRLRRLDVKIIDGEWYEFIRLNVCGVSIVATHGDLDNIKNLGTTMNTLFSKKFNETIDLAVMGDQHHLEEFERYGIESAIIRSLCGSDSYANEKRLYSSAGQTLMIFNPDEGRECTYNMKLD